MAKFICKNCKNEFDKFCDKLEDSLDIKCPNCGSHWVESIFEEDKKFPNIFPVLPYTDPPYPQPWIGDPWPPHNWKLTYSARPSDW